MRAMLTAVLAMWWGLASAGPPVCVEETQQAARIACLTAAADAAMLEVDRAAVALAGTLALTVPEMDLPDRIGAAQDRWRDRAEGACAAIEAPGPRFAEAMRQTCRRVLAEARLWRLTGGDAGPPAFAPYVRLRPGRPGAAPRADLLLALPAPWP